MGKADKTKGGKEIRKTRDGGKQEDGEPELNLQLLACCSFLHKVAHSNGSQQLTQLNFVAVTMWLQMKFIALLTII